MTAITENQNPFPPALDWLGMIQSEIKRYEAMLPMAQKLEALKMIAAANRGDTAERKKATIQLTLNAVASEFGISIRKMMSKTRLDSVAFPRQIAMTLLRENESLGLTLEKVAAVFKKDHGTVIYAIQAVEQRCDSYPRVKARVDRLREILMPKPEELLATSNNSQ